MTTAAPVLRTLQIARPAARRITVATLLGAASVGAGIALLATSGWLISRASQHPSIAALGLAVVGVRFFAVSRGLFRYGERLVGHDAAFRVLADLRVRVYERLERLAPAGLPAFRRGDLLARLVRDVDTLQDLMVRVIPPWGIAAVVGAGTVGFVWWLIPAAGLVLGATLLLAATLVPWLARSLARSREARLATARGELATTVVDLLEGAPDLIAYGAAPDQLRRIAAADAELTQLAAATSNTAGVGAGLTALLAGLAVWGAVLVGVPAVRSGQLDGVLLAVVVLVPLAAFELVAGLPTAAQSFEQVRRSAARVFAVVDAPPPVTEPASPAAPPERQGVLHVRGLRATYSAEAPWALDGVDLDLAPGRRIGVVGPSGAGKTTLAWVLLRFLPYEHGSVSLDSAELSTLDGDDVRRVIGLVEQDAHVFDTSLRENLLLARRGASDRELRDALDRARLLEWVDDLPNGLDTEVGEHGARLSGGQRQRIAIARALLADFPLLVLDEPGEHLDVETADALTADLIAASPDRAVLVITHRLAGLEAMDEILVLDSGQVVERGTHDELMARAERYAWLWRHERGDTP
jgi:thiol reductant ABC exporter CydC subunit